MGVGLSGISIDRLKRGWSIKFIKLWPVYVVAPCNETKAKELGLLEQATKRPEFSSVLQQLFSEFRAFRVGPADLERGAETVKNNILQKKLRELAICMSAYEEELSRHGERDIDPIMNCRGFATISSHGE